MFGSQTLTIRLKKKKILNKYIKPERLGKKNFEQKHKIMLVVGVVRKAGH